MGLTKFKTDVPTEVWCHYCHRLVPPSERTVDHKTPVVKGGTNTNDNLVWACYLCNVLKSDMDYEEFRWRIQINTPKFDELRANAQGKRVGDEAVALFQRRWHKFQNQITRI